MYLLHTYNQLQLYEIWNKPVNISQTYDEYNQGTTDFHKSSCSCGHIVRNRILQTLQSIKKTMFAKRELFSFFHVISQYIFETVFSCKIYAALHVILNEKPLTWIYYIYIRYQNVFIPFLNYLLDVAAHFKTNINDNNNNYNI